MFLIFKTHLLRCMQFDCTHVHVLFPSRPAPAELHGLMRAWLRKQQRIHAGQQLNVSRQLLLQRLGSSARNLDVSSVDRLFA